MALVLLAVAFDAHRERAKAVEVLDEALALAEPGGLIRLFVDEGAPMDHLLRGALSRGNSSDYLRRLVAAFPASGRGQAAPRGRRPAGSVWLNPSAHGSSRFSIS